MFRLIPLACGARTDEVLDQLPHVGEVKIAVQAVGGALDTLMTHRERCQDLLYQEERRNQREQYPRYSTHGYSQGGGCESKRGG